MSLASRLSKMEGRIASLEAANATLSAQLHDVLNLLADQEEETVTPISFMEPAIGAERDETQSLG